MTKISGSNVLDQYQTTGTIRDDGLELADSAGWGEAIVDFIRGPVILTMQSATAAEVRSMQANKRQWVIFTIIAEASGHTKEEVHDWMCKLFLSYEVEIVDPTTGECGSEILVRGTSKLKPAEHNAFLDRVMLWAAEFFGCEFPEREAV